MNSEDIRTFEWIWNNRAKCRYDLSRNELYEQDLASLGIRTSYDDYLKEKDPERYFKQTVAELYGVDEENVIPTIGGTEAIFIASGYLGSLSREILIPAPEYEPLFIVPRNLGSSVVLRPDFEAAEAYSGDGSAMLTSPGNPEGVERIELFDRFSERLGKNSRIYVDETFTEFKFKDRPDSLFNRDQRTIVSGTMTKFFGLTKIRTGWILSHEEDRKGILRVKSMSSAANPRYPMWLAANVLRGRSRFAGIVKRLIQSNLPVADEFVSRFDRLSWKKPDSAPFGFVRYDLDVDSVTLCSRIYEDTAGLLVPGSFFGVEHEFRLCFFLEPSVLIEAFETLTQYFEDHLSSMG